MMEAITDPQNIVLALVTMAAFMTVVAVAMMFKPRDNLASRLETVTSGARN